MSTPGVNRESASRQGSRMMTNRAGASSASAAASPMDTRLKTLALVMSPLVGRIHDAVRRDRHAAAVRVVRQRAVFVVDKDTAREDVAVLRVPLDGVVVQSRRERREQRRPHHRHEQRHVHGARAPASGYAREYHG